MNLEKKKNQNFFIALGHVAVTVEATALFENKYENMETHKK